MLAAGVVVGAYVLASLGKTASLPANIGPFLGLVLGLVGTAHIVTRRVAPRANPLLLPLVGLLNGIGYVFVARLDTHLAGLQALWTAIGVAAYVVTLVLVRRAADLDRYRYLFALVGMALLVLPLAPVVGRTINGARLWVRVGPLSFQPVELAKIALAVFFCSYLVEKAEVLAVGTQRWGPFMAPQLRHFGPLLAAWGVSMLIMIGERDVGFSLLFLTAFVALLWIATGRAIYLGFGTALFAAGAVVASKLFGHVHERIQIWVNPWPYASTKGYQIVQALFALAAGGIGGTGLALGSPQRIPVVASDFIFAAIGEELGLLGTAAVITAFVLLVGTGMRIALAAVRRFDKLLAAGLTAIVGLQAFFIMAGVTRLLPLTGVTLPFVSYGGSSLVANYIIVAVLARISDDTRAVESATAIT